ncbi:MAG: hypothetical protein RLY31_2873, partial [Bacteroidota bacterium]
QYGDATVLEPVDPIVPAITVADASQASQQLPSIIDNAGNNRGAGFNGEYVYIASRQNGNHIYFWDKDDPLAAPDELDITGVTGGTFTVSDLAVSGPHVLVSNMVFVGGTFKVYHWSDNGAAPAVLLEYANAPARLGDAITVIGDPATEARLIASGHGTKDFYVWDIVGGTIPDITPTILTLDMVDHVNFARITQAPGAETYYIASGPAFRMLLLDSDWNVVDQVDGSFFPGWSMNIQSFEFAGRRFLSYVQVSISPDVENTYYVLDITEGTTFPEAVTAMKEKSLDLLNARSISLGTVSNGNASVGHDVVADVFGNVWSMAYAAGNGFIVDRYGDALPPEPVDPLVPVSLVLDQTQAGGNLPAIIDAAGNNRGAGFNGQHVFVASRQNGDHVYYWTVNDLGLPPAELDLTGVSGGTFTVSDLTVVEEDIFLSNMVFVGGTFKVYHWNGVSGAPEVLLEYADAPARLGDAITVVGDPKVEAKLIASGHGTKDFYSWDIINGTIANNIPTVYTFDNVDNVNFARITAVPGDEGYYIASGPVFRMLLLDQDFQVVDQVDETFFGAWPMYIQAFDFEGRRFLSYVHVNINPVENELRVLDITAGADIVEAVDQMKAGTVPLLLAHSAQIGNISNGNASVSHDLVTDSLGNIWSMSYSAGNGFIIEQYGDSVAPVFADPIEPVIPVADFSQAGQNLPDIINTAGNNRGAGFNGNHVYVASRQNGDHVYYWDAKDLGAGPAELDLAGISGGTFTLSDVTVTGNHVFVSNMAFAGGTFKVYHWADNAGVSSVLLEYPNTPARLGDAITVIGDPSVQAHLYASGHGTKDIYRWTIESGNVTNTTPTVITFDQVENVNFARITSAPGAEGYHLLSGPLFGILLLDADLNVLDEIGPDYFQHWPMYAQVFDFGGKRYLSYVKVNANPAENALHLLDITDGSDLVSAMASLKASPLASRLARNVSIGNVSNGNASVSLDLVPDPLGNIWCMAYSAGNGFIIEQYGDEMTGIGEVSALGEGVLLFPNPAASVCHIRSESAVRSGFITDLAGKVVRRFATVAPTEQFSLDVSMLLPGTYVVRLVTGNNTVSAKLVISR